jgi:hypothetical protein
VLSPQDPAHHRSIGRLQVPACQQVGERRRGNLDAAQIHAIAATEHGFDAIRLGRLGQFGEADEHCLAGEIEGAPEGAGRIRGDESIIRNRLNRPGRSVEIEVKTIRTLVEADPGIQQRAGLPGSA